MLTPIIKSVEVLEDYQLLLTYENGEKRIYDMKPNFKYEAFRELEDYELFKKVHPAGETIEWETGEDVSPESLYLNSIKVNN